ncbi:hypothetical protein [Saccharolobus islandicus]|uniref:hypothetical protein n=1 Tax=Saccharolobus islandicus TaxID=43080 RepID=UPI000494B0F2|nr:hypothetical protein [Sulfolobus islandicus]
MFFSYIQGIFRLGRREIVGIGLIGVSFLAMVNWIATIIIVLLGFKVFGIISNREVKIVENFIPSNLKRVTKILYLVAK